MPDTRTPISVPNSAPAPPAPETRPCTATVLLGHLLFTVLNAVLFANTLWLTPMLVRLHFGSTNVDVRDWQTAAVTAAAPALMVFSIFWSALQERVGLSRYLVYYWLCAVLPFLGLAVARNYNEMFVCHIIAAAGYAGWAPLDGRLVKHFYSDAVRGRVFAILNAVRLGAGLAAVFFVGNWLEHDPTRAFRIFLTSAVVLQSAGMLVLGWLIRVTAADAGPRTVRPRQWRDLIRPVLHLREILASDRSFFHYEKAYMTYGAAFMLCDGLLPVLATSRLGMGYQDFSHSTMMVRSLAMLIMLLPMGWIMDRFGPAGTSGIAFLVLSANPLVLLAATGFGGMAVGSTIFGAGLAGVMMGWTLGPVALAPSAGKVPQYVAIHATLVGLRGLIFQGVGMLLYKLSGDFTMPLLLATILYLWAAVQMRRLHGTLQAAPSPLSVP